MIAVVVRSLPPIYTPQRRDESLPVPGRHGALHIQDGAYEEQLMMIEGYLPYEQGVAVSGIETIKAWLTGQGDLTLSDRPGRRYKARIVDAVAFSAWVAGFSDRIFSVSFWCDPFAYEAEPTRLTLYAPFTLVGPGTAASDPVITVYGSGDMALSVGGVGVALAGVTGSVTIDSDAKVAYTSPGNSVEITLTDEAWLTLSPGGNLITWSGSVSKIDVQPNWRWL